MKIFGIKFKLIFAGIIIIPCILLQLIVTVDAFSQKHDSIPDKFHFNKSRLFAGGNIGLQFGSATFVDFSPLIGYRFTDKIHGGFGVTYRYFRDNYYNYSADMYGWRVFGRYYIIPNLFAHTEYEILNLEYFDNKRHNVTSIFVGGGYSQNLGGRLNANVLVLWNINESMYSPYNNPIFRAGIGIGL